MMLIIRSKTPSSKQLPCDSLTEFSCPVDKVPTPVSTDTNDQTLCVLSQIVNEICYISYGVRTHAHEL